MTISDTDKLDLLFKRSVFGVAKTADVLSKTGANETIMSPMAVFDTSIWTLASSIPAVAPTGDTDIVQVHVRDTAIKLTPDPTAPETMTWLSPITQVIPASFGVSYAARVWMGDPSGPDAARLYPDTSGEEWTLDGNAGVLLFPNATPTTKTTSSGATVSLIDGIYLEGYAYVGPKGFPQPVAGPLTALDVVPGLVQATPLGLLLAGSRIVAIEITVLEAFDGNAALTVGNTTTLDAYMVAEHSDLIYPGTYLVQNVSSPCDDLAVTVTLCGAPTVGRASLRVVYA